MKLEEGRLYTYMEVVNYLTANRKAEIRLYVNIPEKKNLRALMFDDGESLYSVNITQDAYMFNDKPVTKCIFNNNAIANTLPNEDY